MTRYLAVLCIGLVVSTGQALACSAPVSSVAENYAAADVVFLAHVFRLEEMPVSADTREDTILLHNVEATFRLLESFKGNAPDAGTVQTSLSNCHVTLLPSGQYVIFAERDRSGRLTALPHHLGSRWFLPNDDRSGDYLTAVKRLSLNHSPPNP